MTVRDNRGTMGRLFDDFVEALRTKVKGTTDEEGRELPPSAADLNVIRQFLKDQNVAADEDKHAGLRELGSAARKLPFSEQPTDEDL